MCIVLLTTAHPDYALILIDNRDEFILRPTSKPHWWTAAVKEAQSTHSSSSGTTKPNDGDPSLKTTEQQILSSRDLQRTEQGTWLGITRSGQLAVLTNYRELDIDKFSTPPSELKSRGAMVTAWLAQPPTEPVESFIKGMVDRSEHENVGGFSLLCGRLRKRQIAQISEHKLRIEALGILSNRSNHNEDIPWLGGERDKTWGLSNTWYRDPKEWPKVRDGKAALQNLAEQAVKTNMSRKDLQSRLFDLLDQDTLPGQPDTALEAHLAKLKESIFVPAIGDKTSRAAMARAAVNSGQTELVGLGQVTSGGNTEVQRSDVPELSFAQGLYGTQRQTIVLVDWDGNVTYTERALWDERGRPITRGEGDETFSFKIEGWEDSTVA